MTGDPFFRRINNNSFPFSPCLSAYALVRGVSIGSMSLRHLHVLEFLQPWVALLDAFWVGDLSDIPSEIPVWCEVWIRYEKTDYSPAEQDFTTCCAELGIEVNQHHIVFPERLVRRVRATHDQLLGLLEGCNYLGNLWINGHYPAGSR